MADTNSGVGLDTSAAIDLLGEQLWVAQIVSTAPCIWLPTPTVSELVFGDLNNPRIGKVSERLAWLLDRSFPLDITADVARTYAELRLELERSGRRIPMSDLWIAACCVANKVPLVARDAHFTAVPQLELVEP